MRKISREVSFKLFLIIIPVFYNLDSNSQTIIKYYNADWEGTFKEKAVSYATFVKEADVYQCTSYWTAGNILRGRSTFPDTSFEKPIGLQRLYFKNGSIEDSIFYVDGKVKFQYHFYPNRQLALHYYIPDNSNKGVVEGYDEEGRKIKNYIYERDAEFKGGIKGWTQYLQKNTSKEIPVKSKGDITAQVQVKFIIDEDGNVTNVNIFKSSGHKEVDRDALRIISESPTWRNAILFNKPVKVFRIQPISYSLIEEKK